MEVSLRADGWTTHGDVTVRGRAFDGGTLLEAGSLAEYLRSRVRDHAEGLESVATAAMGLEGFFAAVVRPGDATYLVADAARSIPLYYDAGGTVVSDRGRVVREAIGAGRDPVSQGEFLLTRYVTGPGTIWAGVRAVQPGEVVRLGDGAITRRTYREYWSAGGRTERDGPGTGAEASVRTLRAGLETALDRLEAVAGDRPVVVPLSGGYDSRLVASALVERGREVIAFAFGRSGHPDVEVSREVAARLGIRWEFLPYDEATWWEWYHGRAGRTYRREAFGGDALPFLAEVPALVGLLEAGRLPADALYCPGHTVATPSERLPRFVGEPHEGTVTGGIGCGSDSGLEHRGDDRPPVEPSLEGLLEYVLERHYTLWDADFEVVREALGDRLSRELLGGREPVEIDGPASAAAAYERWEWRGRMATFTNGDLRAYEAAGVDWWLPLWGRAYVDAWERLALPLRRNKRLHAALAVESYRAAADVPVERAALTDRTLSPVDRHCSLVRHTPERQFTECGGRWEPPFLAPRASWGEPASHPLAWYGAIHPALRERLSAGRDFYALRVLAETGRLSFSEPGASLEPPDVESLLDSSVDD